MINKNEFGVRGLDFDKKKIEEVARALKTLDVREIGAKDSSVKMFFEIALKANPNLKLAI